MKKEKFVFYICLLLLTMVLTSCTGKNADAKDMSEEDVAAAIASDQLDTIKPDAIKSWAAIYEKNKEVLSFNKNGSAEYKGVKYSSYSIDDSFITFSGTDELKSRYMMKRKKMLLYETKEYKREATDAYKGVPEGSITGLWSFDANYSFEFTENGTFYEDRNFPGHYLVNEEDHSIKLMYNDHFEDIYLYYELVGDVLKIEYPWSLVPTEAE